MTNALIENVPAIIEEAKVAAFAASDKFFKEELGGQDQYACGFAWVNIYGVKMNTKMGKAFKAAGLSKTILVQLVCGILQSMVVRMLIHLKQAPKRRPQYLKSMALEHMLGLD
jgi:hypothetical protein